MAEEIAESCSVMTSSSSAVVPPSNWWDLQGPSLSALSPWCNNNNNNNTSTNNNNNNNNNSIQWHHRNNHRNLAMTNPNSNSDEDVSISTSFTNASNHSGLTVESSRRLIEPAASSSDDLIGPTEPQAVGSDSHMWSHVLLNVGSNGDLHSHQQDVGENFLDMLSSSKSIFESDYLKKLDTSNNNSWGHQFSNSSSPNSLNNFVNNNNNSQPHNKLINNFSHDHHHHPTAMNNFAAADTERFSKLSNLISTWSIAPPESADQNPLISLRSSSVDHDHHHHHQYLKQTLIGDENPGLFAPCFAQNNDPKIEINEASDKARASLTRSFNSPYYHHHHQQVGLMNGTSNNIMGGGANNGKLYNNDNYGMINSLDSYNSISGGDDCVKKFADVISFSGRLGKPLFDIQGALSNNNKAPASKPLSLSDSKKQGRPAPARSSGKGKVNSTSNSSEAKKKRSEDSNSETSMKRPKHEDSTASSAKIQAPKVKLTERITALQQIVSPFGKTDTASVLLEAIQYIKFLQEQVQLLSNPYMKTNPHKDPWASLERKADHLNHHHTHHMKVVDLRSRGLCLVPISCTPQVCRENTGSDYWTPTYRGCLYR